MRGNGDKRKEMTAIQRQRDMLPLYSSHNHIPAAARWDNDSKTLGKVEVCFSRENLPIEIMENR